VEFTLLPGFSEKVKRGKKLKIVLLYNPAIPLPVMYPDKTIIQKDTCIPVLTALFTKVKT